MLLVKLNLKYSRHAKHSIRNPWQLKDVIHFLMILITMTMIIYIVVRHLRQSLSLLITCRFPLVSVSGQSLLYNAKIMLDVSQNAGDALQVFQDVHALCVGIVMDLKWTENSLCKSPAKDTLLSFNHEWLNVASNIDCWPHFVLGLLKTLWNKVGILDCG